jgi:hypothetical protein
MEAMYCFRWPLLSRRASGTKIVLLCSGELNAPNASPLRNQPWYMFHWWDNVHKPS